MGLSRKIIEQMENDIKRCENQKDYKGSQALYNELIARYTLMYSDFRDGLPSNGKVTVPGDEFDFKPELRAISAKLKMILLMDEDENEDSENLQLQKVKELLQQGEVIKKEEYHSNEPLGIPTISGPKYEKWMADINIFNERYLKQHPLYDSIHTTFFHKRNIHSYDNMMGYLSSIKEDKEFWSMKSENEIQNFERKDLKMSPNKVFIVHGHDRLAETEVALFVERLSLKAIILHEQPNSGKTIIEKIEANSDVQYAVVLYTPCDMGRAKEDVYENEKERARQNVVFEHGYLIGKLGRDKVSALVKGDIDTPGDISGVVYIPMDDAGAWKMQLVKEMKSAGLELNMDNL